MSAAEKPEMSFVHGGHTAVIEERPDARYLFYRYGNDFSDARALAEFQLRAVNMVHALPPRPVGVIVDQRQESGSRPGPEARRAMMEGDIMDNMFAIAFFGADFPIRSLSTLIVKGARMMGKIPNDVPVVFVKTEEEACQWMSERDTTIGQTSSQDA